MREAPSGRDGGDRGPYLGLPDRGNAAALELEPDIDRKGVLRDEERGGTMGASVEEATGEDGPALVTLSSRSVAA